MTNRSPDAAAAAFDAAIARATAPGDAYAALQTLAETVVGARLFTVMTLDMQAGLARRAYTSDPVNYPGTGTKPIVRNGWFEVVHTQRRPFVANTIDDIAEVFPDHALIDSLGCQSVINLPVVLGDELVATVNMLHETGFYTPERVETATGHLAMPAKLSCAIAAMLTSRVRAAAHPS